MYGTQYTLGDKSKYSTTRSDEIPISFKKQYSFDTLKGELGNTVE